MIENQINFTRWLSALCFSGALASSSAAQTTDSVGLVQRLAILEDRVKTLEKDNEEIKRDAVVLQSGEFAMVAQNTRGLRDGSACPEAETGDAYRGTLDGRIKFSEQFAEPPKVILALREATIVDATRLTLRVTAVDKSGFNYRFVTWCRTLIYDARAVWVAHGRMAQ